MGENQRKNRSKEDLNMTLGKPLVSPEACC